MGPPGHIAIAFATKHMAPKVPLIILLLATELIDLLAFAFIAMGLERTAPDPWFPWSHGLFMSAVWSLLGGTVAYALYHDRRAGVIVAFAIFSHWLFDFVSHFHDLPLLFARTPLLGLGLESSVPIGLAMEFTLLIIGLVIYFANRKRKTSPSRT